MLGGHLLGVSRYAGGVSGWDVPGQGLCDAADRVVGDVGKDVSEKAFGSMRLSLAVPSSE